MSQQHITNERAIFTLWLNWTIGVGALAVPEFAGLFVPKLWLPIIILALILLLFLYRNTGRKFQASSCDLIQTLCFRTLWISALIMLLIGVIYTRGFIFLIYPEEMLNPSIPYLGILIIGPVSTLVCVVGMLQGHDSKVCHDCIVNYGTASERGFLGKIFFQESSYQLRTLLILSVGISVFAWIYYAIFYINVNLNSYDRFIYNWVPTLVFIFSSIFFGMRYFSLWGYYYNHIELNPHVRMNGSGVRFIILCDDNIFLGRGEDFHDTPDGNKYDTPVAVTLSHKNAVSIEEAQEYFHNMCGLEPDEYSIRFMYKSTDLSGLSNVFHFICSLPSKEVLEATTLNGRWFNLSQLQRLLYNHDLSQVMAAEIHRLYTVTMAWKTYNIEGRRLYKMKNYRPAFRLKGISDWEVDFNNPQWLDVARFNEDKPLFRLRKLFRRSRRD